MAQVDLRTLLSQRAGLFGLVGVVALYVLVFLQQAGQPYTIDEAAFPYGAEGILRHGTPEFYNGETRPTDMGLWHPPLYIYSLAFNILIFGDSPMAVRLYGLFAILGAWLIGLAIIRGWYPTENSVALFVFSVAFLLNPLVVSGSLVPDIDGTIAITIVVAFMWLCAKVVRGDVGRHFLTVCSVLWLVSFATKLTLSAMLIPIVVLAALLAPSDKIKRAAQLLAGAVIGAFGALLLWFLAATILRADFAGPFEYFLSGLDKTGGGSGRLATILDRLTPGTIVFWIGTGLIFVAAVCLVVVLAKPNLRGERRLAIFCALAAAFSFFAYLAITPPVFTFPKYWGVVVPFLAMLLAIGGTRLQPLVARVSFRARPVLPAALVTVACSLVIVALMSGYHSISSKLRLQTEFQVGTPSNTRSFGTFVAIAIAVAVAVSLYQFAVAKSSDSSLTKDPAFPRLLRISLAGLIAAALLLSVATTLAFRSFDGSTRYFFGERNIAEVAATVESIVPVDQKIVSAKDIGLLSQRRFFEDANMFIGMTPEQYREFLIQEKPEAIVTRNGFDYSATIYPEHFNVIEQLYTPIPNQPSPDFTIWVPKASSELTVGEQGRPARTR